MRRLFLSNQSFCENFSKNFWEASPSLIFAKNRRVESLWSRGFCVQLPSSRFLFENHQCWRQNDAHFWRELHTKNIKTHQNTAEHSKTQHNTAFWCIFKWEKKPNLQKLVLRCIESYGAEILHVFSSRPALSEYMRGFHAFGRKTQFSRAHFSAAARPLYPRISTKY